MIKLDLLLLNENLQRLSSISACFSLNACLDMTVSIS